MTILVAGARSGIPANVIEAALEFQHTHEPITRVLHAGHDGVDQVAARWAVGKNIQVAVHPCHCKQDGQENWQLWFYGNPDLVLAFPGGRGTANMVAMAEKVGVSVRKIRLRAA